MTKWLPLATLIKQRCVWIDKNAKKHLLTEPFLEPSDISILEKIRRADEVQKEMLQQEQWQDGENIRYFINRPYVFVVLMEKPGKAICTHIFKYKEMPSTKDTQEFIFTRHALAQFEKRYFSIYGSRLKNPENTANRLIANATTDDSISNLSRLKRLLANDCKEVIYLMYSGWRFIVRKENGKLIVITIERDLFSTR